MLTPAGIEFFGASGKKFEYGDARSENRLAYRPARLGLGRTVALRHRSSTLYWIH